MTGRNGTALEQLVNLSVEDAGMATSEERWQEITRKCLTYVKADAHNSKLHWDMKYPWIEDPVTLTNNRSGVEGTFLRTEKRFKKEPEWRVAFGAQIHEMVGRKRSSLKRLLPTGRGQYGMSATWWHQTHILSQHLCIWYRIAARGSRDMNEVLLKGPDVLNPIQAVLLRFRRGVQHSVTSRKCTILCGWKTWKCIFTDFSGKTLKTVRLKSKPSPESTLVMSMFAYLEEEHRILEEEMLTMSLLPTMT